jgi:Do/DeqQ family serine protease
MPAGFNSAAAAILIAVATLLLPRPVMAAAPENLRESPVVKAVRRVSPAVVNISTVYETRGRSNPFSGFGNPFFDEFFKDFFDPRFEQRQQHTSLGSGVIIDGAKGLILTNAHVIQRSATIKVVLQNERQYDARVVGADPDSDLAVLKIDSGDTLPAVAMGNSDDLMIGESVIAIGNPFGFSHTVTTGVVSAVNRSIRSEDRVYNDFIQIDASINPGNSGGPLLNINGELIGINTAIYAKAQGIGFAIPISKAKKVVADLVQYGEVKQAWIGLNVQELPANMAQYLKYPAKKGVMIKNVEAGSPAQKAGLAEGDIVLSIGGRKIAGLEDYDAAVKTAAVGEALEAQIWRSGLTKNVALTPRLFPIERADQLAWELLGVRVAELTAENRKRYKILAREGILISDIRDGAYLARIGVRRGDVIRQIDDVGIASQEDFRKTIVKFRQKGSLVLLIQREDQGYYVTVTL